MAILEPVYKHFTMQTIVEQNNLVVALLQSQDFAGAVDTSSVTLRCFKDFVANGGSFSSSQESASHNSSVDYLDHCILLSLADSEHREDFDNCDYIHEQGILLLPPSPTTAGPGDAIMPTILVFNAALSLHLCANQYPERNMQYLLQARNLYAMAYQMHGTTTSSSNALFRAAVINNSALIERDLGNDTSSKLFFDCLVSIWVVSVDQACSYRLFHLRRFLWNILRSDSSTAPAA